MFSNQHELVNKPLDEIYDIIAVYSEGLSGAFTAKVQKVNNSKKKQYILKLNSFLISNFAIREQLTLIAIQCDNLQGFPKLYKYGVSCFPESWLQYLDGNGIGSERTKLFSKWCYRPGIYTVTNVLKGTLLGKLNINNLSLKVRCTIYTKLKNILEAAKKAKHCNGFQHNDLHINNIIVQLSTDRKSLKSVGVIDFGFSNFDNLLIPNDVLLPVNKIAHAFVVFKRKYDEHLSKQNIVWAKQFLKGDVTTFIQKAKSQKTSDGANLFLLKSILCSKKL